MRVQPIVPDVAAPLGAGAASRSDGNAFGKLLDAAGAILERADAAESMFIAHRGGLQEMVVERARADVALQIAAAAAQRSAQAIQTLLGMQV